jgi:GT2 family glycosyltransferase
MSSVSVVIPNWNGAELLPAALDSLAAQTHQPLETIVVDNGSSDRSVELIRARWPSVKVIELPVNRGFGGGVNAGIEIARGEWVALVNNDVELAPDWLAEVLAAAERHPQAAAVAGKLLDFTQRMLIEECGTEWIWSGAVRHRGEGERDRGQYDREAEVFSVCAAAALYRRDVLARIGPFDARYFAYFEDVDWCFRARLAGYVSLFTPAARAYHRRRASTEGALDLRRLYTRNCWLVMLKCYSAADLCRNLPAITLRAMKLPLHALRRGWFASYLRAVADILVLLPYVRRARRAIASA